LATAKLRKLFIDTQRRRSIEKFQDGSNNTARAINLKKKNNNIEV